jgi:hypothetical protein
MRGAGGPPDGHDPEALPVQCRFSPSPCGAVVLMLIIVPIRFSNRHAMFGIPNFTMLKNPK